MYNSLFILLVGASMTLAGLLPPLCDNGNVLVDGGYGELLLFRIRNGMFFNNCFLCTVDNLPV